MKFKDIEPGVAYAYRETRYGSPEKIMFLAAPDNGISLYAQAGSFAKPGDPAFTPSRASKPDSGRSDVWARRQKHGYPAVRKYNYGGDQPDLTTVTWDDFQKATVATAHDEDRNIRFFVVTRLAEVLGPWDEVIAAEEQRRKEAVAAREKAEAVEQEKHNRASEVVATLHAAGIKGVARRIDGYALTIELAEAEKLAVLLDSRLPVEAEEW